MDQDWTPVILKKSSRSTYVKPQNEQAQRLAKIDSDEPVKSKMFSSESMQKIIKFRVEHKLGQSDMDTTCLFPRNTMNQIEARKRPPTSREVQTLNHFMKTGLTLS